MITGFDAAPILGELKDFQRRTVDYAFARMFDEIKPARRFLVADEVGLGKTLVAKGLIARTIERVQALHGVDERIDIIYVCSNEAIAAQNVARLTLDGQSSSARATRLTLLPLVTEKLKVHSVNFISFTPGTTFNTRDSDGRKEERQLIYQMLRDLPGLDRKGLRNAMKGGVEREWVDFAEQALEFDQAIAAAFRTNVGKKQPLLDELNAVSTLYRDRRHKPSMEEQQRCRTLTGRLRAELARTCLSALRPALVILDEFQRFGELFDNNAAAELAHQLFNYSEEVRVLLLSATPYKMYVADDDAEDHYADFLKTIAFLMPGDASRLAALETDLGAFRTGLLGVQSEESMGTLAPLKVAIESTLRQVMCRTERVGITAKADAMVRECVMVPKLQASDLRDFRWLETIAKTLKQPEVMEYWKSSPYLFNFMRDYSHKNALKSDIAGRTPLVSDLIGSHQRGLLKPAAIESYKPLDPGNPRLRTLMEEMGSQGLWRLLWMPPSLSYWAPAGPYAHVGPVTKHLVFSAWNVVPDALAAMLSYEVERQIVLQADIKPRYSQMPKRFAARLLFGRSHQRLNGMNTLMLMFPSRALVDFVDPLEALTDGDGPMKLERVRERTRLLLEPLVEPFLDRTVTTGAPDRRWYWVALARLEKSQYPAARRWSESHWSDARSGTDDAVHDVDSAFHAHVVHWLQAWDDQIDDLGMVPHDLSEVLALLALAGPATCALRALSRHWPLRALDEASSSTTAVDDPDHRFTLNAAVRISEGLRSQFNGPRAVGLLNALDDEDAYWQRVLHYSAEGNLQAVLDEYVHVLVESKSLRSKPVEVATGALAMPMFEAMSLRTATLRPDQIGIIGDRLDVKPFPNGIRTHFALRYGARTDDDKSVSRKEVVQAAFNSPFWPFVLASTSVGQEGLDFHTWCHSVIHWNLPSNPVDMEQREGRVHRYKGYAVRKNVAARYGKAMASSADFTDKFGEDPWKRLFELALADRPATANDLIPFWLCELEGGASIERRLMLLPVSRDALKYERLRRSLALYRMVFAQPRQQDLLACLAQVISDDGAPDLTARWRIDLAPPDAGADPLP